MEYNKHSICNANLPLFVDEFSKEFASCKVALLINFFSRYNQVELDIRYRNIIVFITPLGLLRQTTLPMGATNSIAQFVRIVTKILENFILDTCWLFVDDVGVKGLYTTYDYKEVCLGVRRYIIEHIQELDRTLERIE